MDVVEAYRVLAVACIRLWTSKPSLSEIGEKFNSCWIGVINGRWNHNGSPSYQLIPKYCSTVFHRHSFCKLVSDHLAVYMLFIVFNDYGFRFYNFIWILEFRTRKIDINFYLISYVYISNFIIVLDLKEVVIVIY